SAKCRAGGRSRDPARRLPGHQEGWAGDRAHTDLERTHPGADADDRRDRARGGELASWLVASTAIAEPSRSRSSVVASLAMALLTPASVRALLAKHGLRPSRRLGQPLLPAPTPARRLGGSAR